MTAEEEIAALKDRVFKLEAALLTTQTVNFNMTMHFARLTKLADIMSLDEKGIERRIIP